MVSLLASNDRGRPGEERPQSVSLDGDRFSVAVATGTYGKPRCALCGRLIFSEESIRAGVGRDCRRRDERGLVA